MTDIELAKKILFEEELTLCVVKDSHVIFKSKERGIKPLYIIYKDCLKILSGASLADRVTGKAAAMICRELDIKEIYTNIISEPALKILSDLDVEYKKIVPYIQNRNKDDRCPMERLAENIDDIDTLIIKIGEFIERQD